MARRQRNVVNPGPEERGLLYLQREHISENVWNNNVNRILRTRRIMHTEQMLDPPPQILGYLRLAGFHGVARVGQFDYDRSLVSALVERWRPETHTFHTTRGECTITLEDVAIQLGLPCAGMPVIRRTDLNWLEVCQWLLGRQPPSHMIRGQRIMMSWLEQNFSVLPVGADDEQIQQFARAYILRLVGGYLMPDRSANRVYLMYLPLLYDFEEAGRYSWGSAVLAHLYRELCNATKSDENGIAGCLSLLHVWAWDRFPDIAPQIPPYPDPQLHIFNCLPPLAFRWRNLRPSSTGNLHNLLRYRSFFDKMVDDEIVWQPYASPQVREFIPHYCLETSDIWLANVPLLCFNIVEWHHPDRVLRQFGRQQPIPQVPVQLGNYHTIQLRGRTGSNWLEEFSQFITAWNNWRNSIVNPPIEDDELSKSSEYMRWYWRHTRKWIQRISSDTGSASDLAEELYRMTISTSTCDDCPTFRGTVAQYQRDILVSLREEGFSRNPVPAPPTIELPRPTIPQDRPSKRRRGYLSNQPPVAAENVSLR